MAINERLIDTEVAAAADGVAASAEQNLILHLDANDVDSYDGDGDIWYDISEHDVTIPLSDNADDLELHLNASDSTSYGGSGTTWTDLSGNSRNGTIDSTVAATFDKDNGGYFDFRGDSTSDQVSISYNSALDLTSSGLTIELWCKPDSTGYEVIYNSTGSSSPYNGIQLFFHSGFDYYIYSGGVSRATKTSGGNTVSTSEWGHYVITIEGTASGSNVKTYINGELDHSNTLSAAYTGSTADILLGNYTISSGSYDYDGKLGAVRIYSKELSASEVGQNYRHGRDYIYTDLVDDTNLGVHLDAGNTDSYDPSSDGSTWSDLTTSNADVTLTSMNADQHDKEIGGWFSFDGSADYGTITNDAVRVTTGGALTVEMWIRPSSISVSNKYFLGQNTNTNASYSYSVNQTNQTLRLLTYSHSGGFAYAVQLTTGNVLTQANKWYHFAFTLSDTIADNVIYINGENVKQATSNGIGTERGDTNQLQIGAINGGNNWQGDIGQVRIYQETLTADQVMQNYLFTKNDYPNEIHFTGNNISSADWNSSGYFDFDGSTEYFETSGNPSALINATDFTVSAWVWRTSGQTGFNNIVGQSTANGGSQNWLLAINGANGDLAFYLYGVDDYTTADNVLSDQTWTHIAGVVEADGTKRMYKNGVLQGSSSSGKSADTNSYNTFVGSYGTSSNKWNGRIGAVKYYNKALTASELLADYNATKSTYGL